MAMVAEDLRDSIKAKMLDVEPSTAVEAQLAFGTALKEYLEENCEITYGWVATNPSGTPDPVLTFTTSPTWVTFNLVPSTDFSSWIIMLGTTIQTSIFEIPSGFILTPLTFGIVPIVAIPSGKDNFDEAMLDSCTKIINGVKLMLNLIPSTGTHGVYTGSATMTSIN